MGLWLFSLRVGNYLGTFNTDTVAEIPTGWSLEITETLINSPHTGLSYQVIEICNTCKITGNA